MQVLHQVNLRNDAQKVVLAPGKIRPSLETCAALACFPAHESVRHDTDNTCLPHSDPAKGERLSDRKCSLPFVYSWKYVCLCVLCMTI